MQKQKQRINQTIKFLKWTKKYSGWWQLICEADNERMNIQMMQMLIKRLANDGFYEVIFVLLEVHKNKNFVKSLKEVLLKELLISELENENHYKIINKLISLLE